VRHRLLVIGGSDQGRQVLDALEAIGDHDVVGILDRDLAQDADVAGFPVVGRDDELVRCVETHGATGFMVAIGDNFTRRLVHRRTLSMCPSLEPVSVVHPAAVVSRSATVGGGSLILGGSVVSNHCVVGDGVLLGTRSSIDHDNQLASFASLAPGATTAGRVRIGECTALGIGASIVHGVVVGEHTVIGAASLVLNDLPGEVVAYGVPAAVARTREPSDPYLAIALPTRRPT